MPIRQASSWEVAAAARGGTPAPLTRKASPTAPDAAPAPERPGRITGWELWRA